MRWSARAWFRSASYMYRVFEGERTWLSPVFVPVEKAVYAICRIDPDREMSWKTYAFAFMAFHVIGFAWLYFLLAFGQQYLPLNPQHFPNMAPDLAFNTAVSFLTNTNWQFYSGESTMSYLSQMAGLAWHNFVSAAAGIVVVIMLIRGIVRTDKSTLGNFWKDLVRCNLYILLPISFVGALLLLWQGVPQNFNAYTDTVSIEGAKISIPQGPMASQEIIKELGTNGGGFVNANSAATFENPTPLSDLLELVAIFLIPVALTFTFGRYAKNQRQGWAIFAAMAILFVAGFATCYYFQAATQSADGGQGRDGQHGRARDALRRSGFDALGDNDDGYVVRRRQRDARLVQPHRRPRADGQHSNGRGHLRRRRRRTVRHVALRDPDGLHRGSHGGPHARVSWARRSKARRSSSRSSARSSSRSSRRSRRRSRSSCPPV